MHEPSQTPNVSSGVFRLLDYIFFLRPMLHPPVWTIIILGYFYGIKEPAPLLKMTLLLGVSSAAAGWAYVVNQISDIESDRINNKLYFLPQGIISVKAAYLMAIVMFGLALLGGFLLGLIMAILFAVGLALGYIYSGKPFYAKNKPLAGALFNGIAHGILPFIAGYLARGGPLIDGFRLSIPYFFAVVAVFIGTTIPDIKGDSDSGKITLAVALGKQNAGRVMTLCLAISFILACLVRDWPLIITAALSLPFYLFASIISCERWAAISIKISILLLSIAACLRFWPYAILLIVILMITRMYYRKKFGMAYPSLA